MRDVSTSVHKLLVETDNGKQILKCPVCNRPLIVDDGEKWKLKTRIVIFLKNKTLAKCKFCRSDVEVPVVFNSNEATNGQISIDPENNHE
jgi:hypothetical protein